MRKIYKIISYGEDEGNQRRTIGYCSDEKLSLRINLGHGPGGESGIVENIKVWENFDDLPEHIQRQVKENEEKVLTKLTGMKEEILIYLRLLPDTAGKHIAVELTQALRSITEGNEGRLTGNESFRVINSVLHKVIDKAKRGALNTAGEQGGTLLATASWYGVHELRVLLPALAESFAIPVQNCIETCEKSFAGVGAPDVMDFAHPTAEQCLMELAKTLDEMRTVDPMLTGGIQGKDIITADRLTTFKKNLQDLCTGLETKE